MNELKKQVLFAAKIAVGMCFSILVAEYLKLDFASSAGIIALLTILTTKWETVRLAGNRIISFGITVVLSWIIFGHFKREWITYAVFIFFLTAISCLLKWKNTISVNAVIGTHFLATHEFGLHAILNELYLVLIGVTVSIVFNLFQNNKNQKEVIKKDIRYIEGQLKMILENIAVYLGEELTTVKVWEEIAQLEAHLEGSLERACEYQNNTFVSHPEYYIKYMEMRMKQCYVLHSLHYEIKKMRSVPEQAKPIANYLLYLSRYITEKNPPQMQLERLNRMLEDYRRDNLPAAREEFESRAILYHVIMELEEFLTIKKRFIESLDDRLKEIYWED